MCFGTAATVHHVVLGLNILKMGPILAVSFEFALPLRRKQQLLSESRLFVMAATQFKFMPEFDKKVSGTQISLFLES